VPDLNLFNLTQAHGLDQFWDIRHGGQVLQVGNL